MDNKGYIMDRVCRDGNTFRIRDKHAEMVIYNRYQRPYGIVLLDKEDVDRVGQYKWCVDGHGYVMTHRLGRIKLHHFLIGKVEGMEIDHINNKPLDNRKVNLRHVTHAENMKNLIKTKLRSEEKMYSPKIREDLIPLLYQAAKRKRRTMTKLVDSILREWLEKGGESEEAQENKGVAVKEDTQAVPG